MTSPVPEDVEERHEVEAQTAEDAVAYAAVEDLGPGLAALLVALTALWILVHGDTDDVDEGRLPEFRDRARDLFRARLPAPPDPAFLVDLVADVQLLGRRHAAEELDLPRDDTIPLLPTGILDELYDIPARVGEAYDEAEATLDLVEAYDDVVHTAAVARRAEETADRTARWAAVRAYADGETELLDRYGIQRVWVCERHACLHCLAYAGKIAPAGRYFPAGLTFGDRPLSTEPVPNPPLHPHCRCRVVGWRGPDPVDGGTTYPEALIREAERAVLLGRSEHASNPARIRAADRLLQAGVNAPVTVRRRARAAVQAGAFQ